MPYRTCSSTASRRSSTSKAGFFVIGLVFFTFQESRAFEAVIKLEEWPHTLNLDIAAADYDSEKIKADLSKGFHVQIGYHIRVYRNAAGLSKLFGDELIYEEHPSFTGSWDVFSGNFEIRAENGKRQYFPTWDEFHRRFFRLKNYPIGLPQSPSKPSYLLAQVRLRKIILKPPINIITAFYDSNEVVTPWKRLEIE